MELLTVDVCALVAEIVRSVSTCAEEKNIQLSVSNGGAAEVQGDREGLRRMITNILQNAILYTLPNGKVSVDVFQDRKDGVGARTGQWHWGIRCRSAKDI